MKNIIRGLLPCLLLLAVMNVQADTFEEGQNYQVIVPAQPTDSKDKIEVIELFWYACPHCYRFQPYLENWAKRLPADVELHYMPAILADNWEIHARAYYTAEALGVLNRIHDPLFDAIHAQKRRLDTEERLMQFFAEQGVSNDKFEQTFHSFTVEAKIRRAKEMGRRYQVRATPSMVINGKYLVDGTNAEGDFNTMLKIVDYLIDKERNAR